MFMQLELKKAQHYVFQSYLQAWCDADKKLWCLRNRNVFKSGTHNIAQQRYFYEIEPWSEAEIKFYKLYISDQKEWVQKALMEHLRAYQYPFEAEKRLDNLRKGLLAHINCTENSGLLEEIESSFADIQKELDAAKKNMTEEFYSDIEGQAVAWLKSLQQHDMSFYTGKDFEDFINFIGIQYFRTKKMSDHFINVMEQGIKDPQMFTLCKNHDIDPQQINPRHFVHMLVWQYQGALIDNLIRHKPHMTLLINKNSTGFLTSDQPIINIKADYKNKNKEPKELILYFPVSPDVAITINDNNDLDKIQVDEPVVQEYNKLIVDASHESIFGDSPELLYDIIKNI